MDITVKEKQFSINFVNNYVHEQYREIENLSFDAVDDSFIEKSKTVDPSEGLKILNEGSRKRREIVKKIIDIRSDILKEVLETNGYEYDQKFWERKTEPSDVNEFIMACINKDATKGAKKK